VTIWKTYEKIGG